MARPQVPTINWRSELSKLDRFLQRDGGAVHIRTTANSPSSAFAKSVRSRMEHETWARPWQTIQIEGNNAATHYLGDMLIQIERSLGLISCVGNNTGSTVQIGTDIAAGGHVDIHGIYINNGLSSADLHAKAQNIISHISTIYNEKRVCLIFFDSDNSDQRELSAFRSVLWDSGLDKLVSHGLLLIVFVGESSTPNWLPDPDEIIELPSRYDDQSMLHAIEDLTAYAMSKQLYTTEAEAIAFAKTLLASNPRPKELHANFAAVLSRMEEWS